MAQPESVGKGASIPSQWLKKHGLRETEAGITMKLKRRTFTAIFFLACIAALELEHVALEEI